MQLSIVDVGFGRHYDLPGESHRSQLDDLKSYREHYMCIPHSSQAFHAEPGYRSTCGLSGLFSVALAIDSSNM